MFSLVGPADASRTRSRTRCSASCAAQQLQFVFEAGTRTPCGPTPMPKLHTCDKCSALAFRLFLDWPDPQRSVHCTHVWACLVGPLQGLHTARLFKAHRCSRPAAARAQLRHAMVFVHARQGSLAQMSGHRLPAERDSGAAVRLWLPLPAASRRVAAQVRPRAQGRAGRGRAAQVWRSLGQSVSTPVPSNMQE
jgi:hypothetical protein